MKLLLLVQNEADVSHLTAAAQAIIASAVNRVWVVFSPAITVDVSTAAAKLDSEIETLRTAEAQAATRTDYEAAKGYKAQREGKELDRAKALRDAWKTAPEEERRARVKTLFAPFMDTIQSVGGFSVKITGHSDHYDREQWVAMLNSLSGVWQKDFVPGSFLMSWPEGVEMAIKKLPTLAERLGPTTLDKLREAGQSTSVNTPPAPKSRRAELEAMHHSSVKKLARELGLDITDMSTPDVIEAIVNAEAAPKREPVEAY